MIIYYILIGLIQGLTEFLPISSSGHVLLFSRLFSLETDMLMLSVIVHLGTLMSVIVVYRKKLWQMLKHPFASYNLKILLSCVITLIGYMLLGDFVKSAFSGDYIIYGFLFTATVLIMCDLKRPSFRALGYKTALSMGLAQMVALFPAISRSGMTITAGIWSGADRAAVTEYSFLMSIPIILGSGLMEARAISNLPGDMVLPLILAFFASFIGGLFAIQLMIRLVKRAKLYYFSIYLIILSILLMVWW